MPDGVEVRVEGVAELAEGTRILAGRIDKTATSEFGKVADRTAGHIRSSLPHRTGRLAASVLSRNQGDGAIVAMGDGVAYAQYVEFGGRGFPHSPTGNFLYPAAMDAEPLLVAAGTQAAERAIEGMQWPSP
ncbi:MAG TPA: HK97 gp10 family phage protein [Thermomicrobiales bacterium]|jgi:hypothetical protein